MFPLMIVLVFLSLSMVVPWGIAVLIWRQRRFMPTAAPWFALTNILAGGEAATAMVALISRTPRIVFWAEALLYLHVALATWAFFMSMWSLLPKARVRLGVVGLVSLAWAVFPWFLAVYLIWPRLNEHAHVIYRLGDYPVIRFFVHLPRAVELLLFALPTVLFVAALGLGVWMYRNAFVRRGRPILGLAVLLLMSGAVAYAHLRHLQGEGLFAAIPPVPIVQWAFALGLAWMVLSQHFGMVMPFIGPDVLQRSREGILVMDREDRLVWSNATARRWMGVSDDAWLGRSAREVLAPYPALLNVLAHPEAKPREVRLEHPKRGRVFLEAYALRATGRSGLNMGRILIFYDLTPWRKLQQQDAFRAESEALARSLLALVVHPVPLAEALNRAVSLLQRPLGNIQPQTASLWLLDQESRRLWRAAWQGEGPPPPDGVAADPNWWSDEAERGMPAPPPLTSLPARSGKRHAWACPLRHGKVRVGMLVLETAVQPSSSVRAVWHTAANIIALLVTRRRDAQRLNLMQQVYEHIQEAVIVFDAYNFILDHNPAAAAWLRIANLKGRHSTEVLPVPQALQDEIEQSLKTRGAWLGTMTTTLPDGREVVVEMSLVRLPKALGRQGVAVIRDVTERERLRRDLERQKTFLENLLSISRTLLASPLSVRETWRAVLRVSRELLGATSASLILVDESFQVTTFFVEEELNVPKEAHRGLVQVIINQGFAGKALRAGKVLQSGDTRNDPRWLYGETLPWRSVIAVPLFYQGRPLGVMTFVSEKPRYFRPEHSRLLEAAADMIALAVYNARLYEEQFRLGQELLRAKEEAEDLRRRQEAFFANLSHEMRTPLQAILGYLEWLRLTEEGFLAYDEELRHIETAAQRLLSMVNLVLEYRRSEEEDRLHVEPFVLADVVRDVQSLVAPLARRNNDELIVDVQPPDLTLESDRQKMLHILLNLVSNAVKFTEDGRVIIRGRLETDEQGREWVRLEVEDTGIGIPEDALPSIFEPFRQADDPVSRGKGGTGLGLALVKRYTELLGGQVAVRSQEGRGSTFTVRIPRVARPEPSIKETSR